MLPRPTSLLLGCLVWALVGPVGSVPGPPGPSGAPAADPGPNGTPLPTREGGDLREAYDALAYRIEVAPDFARRGLEGRVGIGLRVLADELDAVELDLAPHWEVVSVELRKGALDDEGALEGTGVRHRHQGERLRVLPPTPLTRDQLWTVAVRYRGRAPEPARNQGLFFGESEDGRPRLNVTCQRIGAHSWFPCKASFFHPEDKPDWVSVRVVVPRSVEPVSLGRRVARRELGDDRHQVHWRLDAPVPTWAVPLDVGPYEVLREEVDLPGLTGPLALEFHACPETLERAREDWAQVPEVLRVYSERFGPYPFPGCKLAIVDSLALSNAGATCIGYGSSYPRWRARNGEDDPWALLNEGFDGVLLHELAHCWWGHAVSVRGWEDAWMHESLASWAGSLVLEERDGVGAVKAWLQGLAPDALPKMRLVSRENPRDASEAHTFALWTRGPWVLSSLRHVIGDDEVFFGGLRDLARAGRHGGCDRSQLAQLWSRRAETDLGPTVERWVAGSGSPSLRGHVEASPLGLSVDLRCLPDDAEEGFRVPIDLYWNEGTDRRTRRLWLDPGRTEEWIPCGLPPQAVGCKGPDLLLGRHAIVID